MALRTLFRFSMYSVRLFQICALALTMFGVYYSSWLRKSHDLATSIQGDGLEYPTLNETLFIFTAIFLAVEIGVNSSIHRGSDPRISVLSLAVFTLGFCIYIAVPETQRQMSLIGMNPDRRLCETSPELRKRGAVGRATIGAGIVTWTMNVVYVLFSVIDYAETVKGIETELSRDGKRSFWQSEKPTADHISV
ncbi:hypothetical protein CGLO_01430 [Colletotrichum gloeosporioides Cg-14]|uniref:Uncharacterized protein n=1 Tax=Colletotrichum gloeosporioides (strain Cg-14) TaxID=1237896 RepID=T0KRZ8_COLGC|nr:hypothetical protein CGLO_01430 [Colletotrichum gloeosporioides Cg-14]